MPGKSVTTKGILFSVSGDELEALSVKLSADDFNFIPSRPCDIFEYYDTIIYCDILGFPW
jgi:hypothetical protein